MIYITGDTHGGTDIQKLIFSKKLSALSEGDYLLIAGDFGGVWDDSSHDKAIQSFYDTQKYTTLFIDGNHENFDLLNKKPVEEWSGGKIHRISNKIIHLMRGQIYTLEGRTFFTFGGGKSIDKAFRTPGISWWPEEEPSEAECREAIDNLEKYDHQIDFIVTHAAPKTIVWNELNAAHRLIKISSDTEKFLDTVLVLTKYKHWYCGHYHFDCDVKSKDMSVLYERILKIE